MYESYVRCELLTAVTMKVTVLWNVIPCSQQTHLRRTWCLFLHGITFYVETAGTAETSIILTTLNYSQSYEVRGCLKNVHSHFPFSFPQGVIMNVYKQYTVTYTKNVKHWN